MFHVYEDFVSHRVRFLMLTIFVLFPRLPSHPRHRPPPQVVVGSFIHVPLMFQDEPEFVPRRRKTDAITKVTKVLEDLSRSIEQSPNDRRYTAIISKNKAIKSYMDLGLIFARDSS